MFSPSWLSFFLLCLIFCVLLQVLPTSSSYLCHQHEHSALLSFKQSFTFAKPRFLYLPTNKTTSWINGTDCCEWEGITCDTLSHHVIVVDLPNNGIVGTIHSNNTLFQLRHLQVLILSGNNFSSSTISPMFGHFRYLKHLDLSDCEFSGKVPLEIAQLTHLTYLDLSSNYDLKFPNNKIIIQNFTKLRMLNLSYVNLDSMTLEFITNLYSLEYIELMDCNLGGELPASILNLPHLRYLNLNDNNNLTIDNSLLSLSSSSSSYSSPLESLSLSNTNVSSNEIPSFLRQLPHLKELDLSSNNLHGSIPLWVWNISQSINLMDNNLTGKLPSEMNTSKFSTFTSLNLDGNLLVGEIPSWLFRLESLESLDLSNNLLSGNINLYHDVICNFPKLQDLVLSSSGLSVTLSTDDIVNSTVVSKWAVSIRTLWLSNTSICGELPKWFQQLVKDSSSMDSLDLSYNSLTGVLENLPSGTLGYIDVSHNMFTGRPPIMASLNVGYLLASSNQFTGSINPLICNWTSLSILDLSNNSLSGSLPHCLGSMSNELSILNLGSNNIHGTLPTKFSKCNSLEYLDLRDNLLEGKLPQSLAQCTNLQAINLEGNNFKDEFPLFLHTLPNIQVLDLSSNNLHGHIPNVNENHPFSKLQILDLSNNNFSGVIPSTFIQNLRAMMRTTTHLGSPQYRSDSAGYYYSISLTIKGLKQYYPMIIKTLSYINLSNNSFDGEIPECVGNLVAIQGLNLSHNHLSGHIPPSIGNLSFLDSLDLSSNWLTGHIPQALPSITFLEVFDVSNNHLVGLIPHGNNFDTFTADSYKGNLGLCGPPLLECGGGSTPSGDNIIIGVTDGDDDGSTLSLWEIVMMGFGTGCVIGLAWGYYMFSVGRPIWFVRFVHKMEMGLLRFCDRAFGRQRASARIRTRNN